MPKMSGFLYLTQYLYHSHAEGRILNNTLKNEPDAAGRILNNILNTEPYAESWTVNQMLTLRS